MGPKRFPRAALEQVPLDGSPVSAGHHNAQPRCAERRFCSAEGPHGEECSNSPTARPLGPFEIRARQSFVTLKRKVAHGPLKNTPFSSSIVLFPTVGERGPIGWEDELGSGETTGNESDDGYGFSFQRPF